MDRNGTIEVPELRQMLEDISEARAGHRDVPEEAVRGVFEMLDLNRDGRVTRGEFETGIRVGGIGAWYL